MRGYSLKGLLVLKGNNSIGILASRLPTIKCMPRNRHEFIKLEIRLMNDPRFFMLSEYDQLLYIKLLCLAKQTHNHIKKNWQEIGTYARLFGGKAASFGGKAASFGGKAASFGGKPEPYRTPIGVKAAVNRIMSRFEDLSQDRYYIWFRKWDTRYDDIGGVDKDKDKDKDKEKDDICSLLKDWNERQTSPIANFKPENIIGKYGEDKIRELYKKYGKENNGFSQFLGHLNEKK